jgi:hypothetical protein
MDHWQAWCNLVGSLLGALGGLYLTYDILGGKNGPLAVVTRKGPFHRKRRLKSKKTRA